MCLTYLTKIFLSPSSTEFQLHIEQIHYHHEEPTKQETDFFAECANDNNNFFQPDYSRKVADEKVSVTFECVASIIVLLFIAAIS